MKNTYILSIIIDKHKTNASNKITSYENWYQYLFFALECYNIQLAPECRKGLMQLF